MTESERGGSECYRGIDRKKEKEREQERKGEREERREGGREGERGEKGKR